MRRIIALVISLLIAIIFYRDFAHKITDSYRFYITICEYGLFNIRKINILLTSILISMEISISIGILFNPSRILFCIIGIVMELIYLTITIKNYGKTIRSGCNCFVLNNSMEINNVDLFKIGIMIFTFISVILFTIS